MHAVTDKKLTIAHDKKAAAIDVASPSGEATQSGVTAPPEQNASDNLREAIKALDEERTELVKNTIENIKPGKPFDSSVVRDINKLETKKNRLIVARFASLLKKSRPEVQAIVHQIIEI